LWPARWWVVSNISQIRELVSDFDELGAVAL